ncbi:hypothetical protein QBC38DRAFT_473613 [Podospora fimiseda]|uniref:Sm domain-containing protein n=1 Tax=Podospora fimiseda TaxID=252190 RepID=A0AAN7BT00_9PEZI|nr:hypothetical protein QBC38DRAFT_473613 [Podospora fimiseda]
MNMNNQHHFPLRPLRPLTPLNYDTLPTPSSRPEASDFLQTLLNKNLRITTTDTRIFLGSFKCTDSESNIILQNVYEYRPPISEQILAAAEDAKNGKVKLDMSSRYLGLVVVPGRHIVKIEVEEFKSQLRGLRRREEEPKEREREEEVKEVEKDESKGEVKDEEKYENKETDGTTTTAAVAETVPVAEPVAATSTAGVTETVRAAS